MFGKLGDFAKKTLGKVSSGAKTVLKKADGIVDKVENIGGKILDVPILGDTIKKGFESLKMSDPRIAMAAAAAKSSRTALEKTNDAVNKIEKTANKYIDNPSSVLDEKFKKDLKGASVQDLYKKYRNDPSQVMNNDVRDKIRNIAKFPKPNLSLM